MAESKKLHTPTGTPPSQRTLVAADHGCNVLHTLYRLYCDESLCDYTIIAEGQSFRTHKNVLASVSDYFRAMLTGAMLESRQDHVDLKGVTCGAVKILLEYAYTGSLSLNLEDIMEVLAGACHLQMRTAIQLCSQFLEAEICIRTCIDILNIADLFDLTRVRDLALEFILQYFEKVVDEEQLSKLQRKHLCVMLQSNRLVVQTELDLFRHVLDWIDCDRENRVRDAHEIMQHLRFALMRPEELVDHVSITHVMQTNPKCRAYLEEALHYHLLPSRHPMMQTPRTQVRNEPCLLTFGGRYGFHIGYKHNSHKMFVLNEGQWKQMPSTESNFLYAAVAVLDNFMYVCGGMGRPAHARATCHRYDPRTGAWTRLAHMKTRRQSFPLVACHASLFAFGGGSPINQGFDHPPTDKCEVYSIDRDSWKFITPLPEKRKSSSACEFGGHIFVCGGRTENETKCTLWCYDLAQNSWQEKSPMLLPHAGHAMLSLSDQIYVIDRGCVGIEAYNPLVDEWTKVRVPTSSLSGVARPALMGPWVYFLSFIQDGKDYQSKRYNVKTLESEDLPAYPDEVHCVIGAPLALPRTALLDANNNP